MMSSANMQGPGTHGMLTGLFTDRERAEKAYRACQERGYKPDEVSLAMSDKTRSEWYESNPAAANDKNANESEGSSLALEGAGTGAAVGGAVGGIVAAIAAIGTSLLVPGLGLVIAGPLAAGLAGAGAGGLTGGLVGGLMGWGLPEERAKSYEAKLREGGVVMGVAPRSREDAVHLKREWSDQGEDVLI
jgi:hypothetical protein